jgi:hypothetical protein
LKTKNSFVVNPSIVFNNLSKEKSMSNSFYDNVMTVADEAIFVRQLNTEQAIRYIMNKTEANRDMAAEALRQVVTFYKQ